MPDTGPASWLAGRPNTDHNTESHRVKNEWSAKKTTTTNQKKKKVYFFSQPRGFHTHKDCKKLNFYHSRAFIFAARNWILTVLEHLFLQKRRAAQLHRGRLTGSLSHRSSSSNCKSNPNGHASDSDCMQPEKLGYQSIDSLSFYLVCSESNASTKVGSCPDHPHPRLWSWCSCIPPSLH